MLNVGEEELPLLLEVAELVLNVHIDLEYNIVLQRKLYETQG